MTELTSLKGIGEKTAGALMRLGISCAEDLIFDLPRDYECFEEPKEIFRLTPGRTEAVECVLSRDGVINRFNGMTIVNVYISDMTGRLQLSWYNMPYIKQTLKAGSHFVFRGRVYEKNGRLIMSQPKIYRPEDYKKGYLGRLMPVYRLKEGVSSKQRLNASKEALSSDFFRELSAEFLPQDIREGLGLFREEQALLSVHFPRDRQQLSDAMKRICFDELLFFFLLQKRRKLLFSAQGSDYRCRPDIRFLKLSAGLPFELTTAQSEAVKTITRDMSSGSIMNRLLEGDVGSGKTIVAFLAMAFAAFNGCETALLVPTEVLAKQHYQSFTELFPEEDTGLRCLLLCGSIQKKEKERAYELIREHKTDVIIGTHALFQEKVDYDRLGLIVTDEQHRFGVAQREAMKQKGGLPHMLFMSATPIPRTLSMILYGDMDVSILSSRPEGRIPIKNTVVGPQYRRNAYKFIYDEIKKGHRAYIVCPAIDKEGEEGLPEQEGDSLQDVETLTAKLRGIFPDSVRIGCLHGRMKPSEKDEAMEAFKNGETELLVATTVIEVGVDVPEATVMMIENADRFGLSQLHQLRGRVGRGSAQSYCIMINTSESEEAAERLRILRDSNDGFFIASEDLRLRGPGDLFGLRQSGEMGFVTADIYRDSKLLGPAREAAEKLLTKDPELTAPEHKRLSERLSGYMKRCYYV